MEPALTDDGVCVRLDAVTKQFTQARRDPIVAADAVTLEVPPGQMVALTGPSGSGKSTLLHLLAAIARADSGTIVVGDTTVTSLPRRQLPAYRRQVGLVFQRYHLLPALTALENVLAPLVPHRTPFDKTARARELLRDVGLAGREHDRPAQLSGGQQQRVGIARALAGRPGLLLADEPTGNLDSRAGADIVHLLLRLRDETGMTMFIATHSAQVAASCDRIVRLRDGAVVDDRAVRAGSTAEDTLRWVNGLSV